MEEYPATLAELEARRKSRSRGKLFYRLLQQAVAVEPAPYKVMVGGALAKSGDPSL